MIPAVWQLAREMTSVASGIFGSDELRRALVQSLGQATYAAAIFSSGGDDTNRWLELHNKLEVFRLFQHARAEIAPEKTCSFGVLELLSQLQAFGSYEALWLAEGLGYIFSSPELGADNRFLRSHQLPQWSLIPLHAGCGLRLAESSLEHISPCQGNPALFRRELEKFFCAAQHLGRPGFIEILYEALGLSARNLYPELVERLGVELRDWQSPFRDFFWHGIGRAAYFAPSNLLPWCSAPWQMFDAAAMEASDPLAFENIVAGSAWAVCLVNIRHPQIIESVLCHHAPRSGTDRAFRNGIISSLRIWLSSAHEGERSINHLVEYENAIDNAAVRRLWQDLIVESCANALAHPIPSGDLFRFCPDLV